jgi:very-short-patch-repair endonuclease
MNKLTNEEFINRCFNKHGNKYNYSLVKYKNIRSKIEIICEKHGSFYQVAKNHQNGQGCPKCYGDLNITKEEYIEKYGNSQYDYSLLNDDIKIKSKLVIINKINNIKYIQWAEHHRKGIKPTQMESISLVNKLKFIHNNLYEYIIEKETYYLTDKIKIINKLTNDEFYYSIDKHLKGIIPNKVTINQFLLKSRKLHNDKYDYSLISKINNNSDKVNIICKVHGIFIQSVSNHMNMGSGCPKCVGIGKWNTDLLIYEFKKVHENKFNYSKINFENIEKKVEIICEKHGSFYQNIHKHLNGQGCKLCLSKSKGEEYVEMWLNLLKIKYIREYKFKGCKYKKPLYFDFYLPNNNMCIEFDGKQHYQPIKRFGGDESFELSKTRDSVKNKWCFDNKINLLRIKYDEINKIKYILYKELQIVEKK